MGYTKLYIGYQTLKDVEGTTYSTLVIPQEVYDIIAIKAKITAKTATLQDYLDFTYKIGKLGQKAGGDKATYLVHGRAMVSGQNYDSKIYMNLPAGAEEIRVRATMNETTNEFKVDAFTFIPEVMVKVTSGFTINFDIDGNYTEDSTKAVYTARYRGFNTAFSSISPSCLVLAGIVTDTTRQGKYQSSYPESATFDTILFINQETQSGYSWIEYPLDECGTDLLVDYSKLTDEYARNIASDIVGYVSTQFVQR